MITNNDKITWINVVNYSFYRNLVDKLGKYNTWSCKLKYKGKAAINGNVWDKAIIRKSCFVVILLLSIIIPNYKICQAQTIEEAGKTSTYSPEWLADENFWDFESNQTMSGDYVRDAAYSPELKQWVCLIGQGNVCISKDLSHWKQINMGTMYDFNHIIWENHMYIATGAMIMYSYDGITWKVANIDVYDTKTIRDGIAKEHFIINKPYWNGTYYFADGGNAWYNMRFYSNDGINWKYAILEKGGTPYDDSNYTYQYAWNGSKWLWIDNSHAHLCSLENGIWKDENSATMPEGAAVEELFVEYVKWTGKAYYSFDRNCGAEYTSSDGITWTYVKNGLDTKKMKRINEVIWDGTLLYAYGSDSDSDSVAYSSIPGKEWKKMKAPKDEVQWIGAVDNKYYAFDSDNSEGKLRVFTSPDGDGWKEINTDKQISSSGYGEYANGYFYFGTSFNTTYRTKDGKTLKKVDGLIYCEDIEYYKNTYLALSGNAIYRSSNGTKFTKINMDSLDYSQLNAIINTGGIWCTVGREGVIYTSKDGKKFTKRKSSSKNDLIGLFAIDKKLYATGANGTILLSNDNGVTWSNVGLKLPEIEVTDICYGNNMYIAKLFNYNFDDPNDRFGSIEMQMILLSADGIHWNKGAMPESCNGLVFYDGYFVSYQSDEIITEDGSLTSAIYWCSKDGAQWIPHRLPNTQGSIDDIIVGGSKLMMLTGYGDIEVTEGKGENINSNLLLTGTITIPESMIDDDGMDIKIALKTAYRGESTRYCGLTWLHVNPGENQVKFTLPVKVLDLDLDLSKTNVGFWYDVYTNFDKGLSGDYYSAFTQEVNRTNAVSGKDCNIVLNLEEIKEDDDSDY